MVNGVHVNVKLLQARVTSHIGDPCNTVNWPLDLPSAKHSSVAGMEKCISVADQTVALRTASGCAQERDGENKDRATRSSNKS